MAKNLKKITNFEPFKGLTGKLVNCGLALIVSGPAHMLASLKQYLTVENGSVSYRIKQIQRSLQRNTWNTEKLVDELEELKKVEIVEYFTELPDGTLECPPGLWWLCEHVEGRSAPMPYAELPEVNGFKLRPYQVEAVQELLKHERASISMATGCGKTLITCALVHCALSSHKRVLVVVPNIILVEQTFTELKKYFGDNVSAIGGKAKHKPGSWVYVSTINSAQKVIDLQDVVICDEFHHSSADSYVETILAATKASHIWGLTASPCRADGLVLGIHAMCGPIVYEKTTTWCVKEGYLSPAQIFMVHISGLGLINDMTVIGPVAYKRMTQHLKVLQTVSKIIVSMLAKNIPTVVLFKTEKPGEALVSHLRQYHGIDTSVAHAEFRHPIALFRKGESNILVSNSALLGEGFDLPKIGCVIDLTQSSSESLCRQVLGRGLRRFPGKEKLVFFSIVLRGYGHSVRKDDGTSYWMDVYGYAAKKRMEVYSEIIDVKEINA